MPQSSATTNENGTRISRINADFYPCHLCHPCPIYRRQMTIKHKHLAIFLLFTAVFSVLLLSSGISNTEMSKEWNLFDRDDDDGGRQAINSVNDLLQRLPTIPETILQILYLTGILIVPLVLVFSIFSPRTRRMILEEIKRAIPFVIWILAMAYLLRRVQFQNMRTTSTTTPLPDLPAWINNPPLLVTLGIGIVLVTIVVAAAWLLWRRLRWRQPLDRLAEQAQSTITEIEAGGNFTDAIIECYVGMCHVLRRERRIVRAEGMTPREFATRLEQFGLAGRQAQQLTRLFEKVRYGTAVPTAQDKREAINCLEAMVTATSKPSSQIATVKSIRPYTL